MFDITTEHNIHKNFDGKISRYRIRNSSVEWSNTYDPDRRIVRSNLRVDRGGNESVEEHVQRIYAIAEMESMLEEGGLALEDVFGDFTLDPPRDDTIMINFVARRA